MKDSSDPDDGDPSLRDKIIGLGERSIRKSYYPQLVRQLQETERSRAHLEKMSVALLRANRELRAISKCHRVLFHADDEQSLLDDVCRIVCDDAGYRMAWVGYLDEDAEKSVRPVAWAGNENGYLREVHFQWREGPQCIDPVCVAISSSQPSHVQDFTTDPRTADWRDAALQRGFRSAIALPLKERSAAIGVFCIYSSEPNAFNEGEMRLLEELALDLAFGITVLRVRCERNRAEQEVREMNQRLEERVVERTAQLEAANHELEAFSYSVSHDLRAPLRAIAGYAGLLKEDYGNRVDDEGKRMLGAVQDRTLQMEQLIDDILKFSRAGTAELSLTDIDMEKLAREVVEDLLPKGNKTQVAVGALPPAKGDRAMLRQVFVNLLSNAIKFSRSSAAPQIAVSGCVDGDEAVYTVKDNGVGFDEAYAHKLFGVFQRLHAASAFEGTGIGLAIIKRIVVRHGGRVWAEGKPGEGATIGFALPRRPA